MVVAFAWLPSRAIQGPILMPVKCHPTPLTGSPFCDKMSPQPGKPNHTSILQTLPTVPSLGNFLFFMVTHKVKRREGGHLQVDMCARGLSTILCNTQERPSSSPIHPLRTSRH